MKYAMPDSTAVTLVVKVAVFYRGWPPRKSLIMISGPSF